MKKQEHGKKQNLTICNVTLSLKVMNTKQTSENIFTYSIFFLTTS